MVYQGDDEKGFRVEVSVQSRKIPSSFFTMIDSSFVSKERGYPYIARPPDGYV
jgi:hypothetical protein